MAATLKVFFSSGPVRQNPNRESSVFLWPGDQWDDFGFKINFNCRIFLVERPNAEMVFDTEIKLGFWDKNEDPRGLILDSLKETPKDRYITVGDKFFTMLPELKDYRSIVKTLGSVRAIRVLQGLNDMVVAQRETTISHLWTREARKSQVFLQAFLRSSHTFYAYHNAVSVLDGLEYETFGDISSALKIKFQLGTFSNPHELLLEFANGGDLPRNLAVLIGKNGAGKSQTLYQIAEALLKGDERVADASGSRPRINRLVAISPASMSRRTYPPAGPRPKIIYKRFTIGAVTSDRTAVPISQTVQRLIHSADDIANKPRWNLFLESLLAISPTLQLGISTRIASDLPLNIVHLPAFGSMAGRDALLRLLNIPTNAEIVRISGESSFPLSTGENTFVRFAAQLCLEIENGTLLLLDEPETHLHPNLITQFVALLNRLLVMTGSFAIAATHSPFLVREVPRMQVHVLKRTEDKFSSEPIRLRTLGADVGAITEFVFGDELHDSLLERLAEQIQSRPGSAAEELAKLAEELPNELLMQLRRRLKIT
jgi:predicted ATPase